MDTSDISLVVAIFKIWSGLVNTFKRVWDSVSEKIQRARTTRAGRFKLKMLAKDIQSDCLMARETTDYQIKASLITSYKVTHWNVEIKLLLAYCKKSGTDKATTLLDALQELSFALITYKSVVTELNLPSSVKGFDHDFVGQAREQFNNCLSAVIAATNLVTALPMK